MVDHEEFARARESLLRADSETREYILSQIDASKPKQNVRIAAHTLVANASLSYIDLDKAGLKRAFEESLNNVRNLDARDARDALQLINAIIDRESHIDTLMERAASHAATIKASEQQGITQGADGHGDNHEGWKSKIGKSWKGLSGGEKALVGLGTAATLAGAIGLTSDEAIDLAEPSRAGAGYVEQRTPPVQATSHYFTAQGKTGTPQPSVAADAEPLTTRIPYTIANNIIPVDTKLPNVADRLAKAYNHSRSSPLEFQKILTEIRNNTVSSYAANLNYTNSEVISTLVAILEQEANKYNGGAIIPSKRGHLLMISEIIEKITSQTAIISTMHGDELKNYFGISDELRGKIKELSEHLPSNFIALKTQNHIMENTLGDNITQAAEHIHYLTNKGTKTLSYSPSRVLDLEASISYARA